MYENHPELILSLAKLMSENNIKPEIEVFDLAMLYNAYNLMSKGIIKGPVHIQFVFGIYNALPASKDILIFELNEMKKYFPNAIIIDNVPSNPTIQYCDIMLKKIQYLFIQIQK